MDLRKDIMTDRDEIYKIRGRYSSAMGDYEAATDAVRQFDRDLFDGTLIDVGIIAQEAQELKREEEASYKRLSRAREAYFRALR